MIKVSKVILTKFTHNIVAANLSCPETDGKCCPQIAGHGVKKNRLCFN